MWDAQHHARRKVAAARIDHLAILDDYIHHRGPVRVCNASTAIAKLDNMSRFTATVEAFDVDGCAVYKDRSEDQEGCKTQ